MLIYTNTYDNPKSNSQVVVLQTKEDVGKSMDTNTLCKYVYIKEHICNNILKNVNVMVLFLFIVLVKWRCNSNIQQMTHSNVSNHLFNVLSNGSNQLDQLIMAFGNGLVVGSEQLLYNLSVGNMVGQCHTTLHTLPGYFSSWCRKYKDICWNTDDLSSGIMLSLLVHPPHRRNALLYLLGMEGLTSWQVVEGLAVSSVRYIFIQAMEGLTSWLLASNDSENGKKIVVIRHINVGGGHILGWCVAQSYAHCSSLTHIHFCTTISIPPTDQQSIYKFIDKLSNILPQISIGITHTQQSIATIIVLLKLKSESIKGNNNA